MHFSIKGLRKVRRHRLILMIGMGLAVAAWKGPPLVEGWQVRSELRAAEHDLRTGRVGDAQTRLASLARRWPGRGDVEFLLGTCEMVAGHQDDALSAWGRVPDRASEASRANLFRGRLALETGRYGLAERCLERARRAGGDVGAETRQLLRALYWVTGRRDEVRNMLQGEVEQLRDPSEPLRMLWNLDHDPYPIDRMTRSLEQARKAAPDDDRVWLALADLATRVGRFRRGRRLAHALRAGSARRRRGLARPPAMVAGRGSARRSRTRRGPLAAVKLDAVRLARIPCLDGRTTR